MPGERHRPSRFTARTRSTTSSRNSGDSMEKNAVKPVTRTTRSGIFHGIFMGLQDLFCVDDIDVEQRVPTLQNALLS